MFTFKLASRGSSAADCEMGIYPIKASLTVNGRPTKNSLKVPLGSLQVSRNGVRIVTENGYEQFVYSGDIIELIVDLDI